MKIREATKEDFDLIWPIFQEIVRAGETYVYPQNTSKEQALKIWIDTPKKTYVLAAAQAIIATGGGPQDFALKLRHEGYKNVTDFRVVNE